jgi:SprT-like family
MTNVLNDFLEPDCILFVNAICEKERVLIKIKPKRASKYGDFRPSLRSNKSHIITVNQGENKDAFFLTLLHEIAHAIVWNKYGRKVKPHGKEWKEDYRILMLSSLEKGFFSEILYSSLIGFANNIKSSHNYNTELVKALNSLNKNDESFHLISEIEKGSRFLYRDKVYVKGDKIRTRYKCRQKNTLKEYLFNANASVTLFNPN